MGQGHLTKETWLRVVGQNEIDQRDELVAGNRIQNYINDTIHKYGLTDTFETENSSVRALEEHGISIEFRDRYYC